MLSRIDERRFSEKTLPWPQHRVNTKMQLEEIIRVSALFCSKISMVSINNTYRGKLGTFPSPSIRYPQQTMEYGEIGGIGSLGSSLCVLFIHAPLTHHLCCCKLVVGLFPGFSSTCIIYQCSFDSPSFPLLAGHGISPWIFLYLYYLLMFLGLTNHHIYRCRLVGGVVPGFSSICIIYPLELTISAAVVWSWDWSLDFPLYLLFIHAPWTHHLCRCRLVVQGPRPQKRICLWC